MLFTFSPGSVPLSPAAETFVKSVIFKVETKSELSTVPLFAMNGTELGRSRGKLRADGTSIVILAAPPAVSSVSQSSYKGSELLLITT